MYSNKQKFGEALKKRRLELGFTQERLAEVALLHRTYVADVERGKIVERGTHDELIASGGLYSQLYETQFNREKV